MGLKSNSYFQKDDTNTDQWHEQNVVALFDRYYPELYNITSQQVLNRRGSLHSVIDRLIKFEQSVLINDCYYSSFCAESYKLNPWWGGAWSLKARTWRWWWCWLMTVINWCYHEAMLFICLTICLRFFLVLSSLNPALLLIMINNTH